MGILTSDQLPDIRMNQSKLPSAVWNLDPNTDTYIKEAITEYFADKVAPLWLSGDVEHQADLRGIDLTDDQIKEVMELIVNKHDAEIGINWTVIDEAIVTVTSSKEHDPDECQCEYLGNNTWSCGHIDQQ